ncbi:MAG: chloride channel protein, partial [Phycisphaerae bacterium]
ASWGWFAALFPAGTNPLTIAMFLLAAIGLGKIATTAFSIGSGGSGGVFGPAVVIGGALGGATGILCQRLFPGMNVQPGAFALVGMGGFFASAANTPISTIIMVSEMTGNYNLLVPSMLVCILGYVFCRRYNLYQKQLPSHLEAPSKLANMAAAVLRQMTVHQALADKGSGPVVTVPEDLGFRELLIPFAGTTQACIPVTDRQGRLVGAINTRDIRRVVGEAGLEDLVVAGDLAQPHPTVTSADSLLTAIQRMLAAGVDGLIVVHEDDPNRIEGSISREDIMSAYDRHLLRQTT